MHTWFIQDLTYDNEHKFDLYLHQQTFIVKCVATNALLMKYPLIHDLVSPPIPSHTKINE